jgi:uncharacterized Ntn-hydrolase superfamily protein
MSARIGSRSVLLGIVWILASLLTVSFVVAEEPTLRPVATYSIVARDPASGALGVAVQSHWFSVGSVVPWAKAGVGAVATQSFVETAYGPRGLEAMGRGEEPAVALRRLLSEDDGADVRQVAFVDARGRVAAHTGSRCIPGAGHVTGDGWSVQANLMLSGEVPDAMARAYRAAEGSFAERLLATLEAAEAAGGDIRGRQSAAILVVPGKPSDRPWDDRTVELRVEDHPAPLRELRRLLLLHRAYEHMNAGDAAVTAGNMAAALEQYGTAESLVPGNHEFAFWHAYALVTNGRVDDSLPVFARAFRLEPAWMLVVPRLAAVGHLPSDEELIRRILAAGPDAGTAAP